MMSFDRKESRDVITNRVFSDVLRDVSSTAHESIQSLFPTIRIEHITRSTEKVYVMSAETTVSNDSKLGSVGWRIDLDENEAKEMLRLARTSNDRATKSSHVLSYASDLVFHRLNTSDIGNISIADSESKHIGGITLVHDGGWSRGEVANAVIHELENFELSKGWIDGSPTFAWFEHLGKMLGSETELAKWQDELNLPYEIKGLRERLNNWFEAMRDETNIEDSNSYLSKWTRRQNERLGVTQEVIRSILRRSHAQPGYENFNENMRREAERILALHDAYGTVSPIEFESLITEEIHRYLPIRERLILIDAHSLSELIDREISQSWARSIVRQELKQGVAVPNEADTRSVELLSVAENSVYIASKLRGKGVSRDVFDHILHYGPEEDTQRNPAGDVRPAQARKLLDIYLSSYPLDTDGIEILSNLHTRVASWLNPLGYPEIAQNIMPAIRNSLHDAVVSPKNDDIPLFWSEEINRAAQEVIRKEKEKSLAEIPAQISTVFREQNYLAKLKRADRIIPDRRELWLLWQKELRVVLLSQALEAQRFADHLRDYIRSVDPGKLTSFPWQNTEARRQLYGDRIEIMETVLSLKKITDELGWKTPPTIEGFLFEIVGLAKESDQFGTHSLPYEDQIFTKKGLEWRKKMG